MPACLSRAPASFFSTTSPINMGCDHQQESMPISFSTNQQRQQQLGIVSILGSNSNDNIDSCTSSSSSSSFPDYNCHLNQNQLIIKSSNNSIRRTFSADMSSQKWLANNGLSSPSKMKRIGSTHECQTSKGGDSDFTSEERAFEDIWSSIQSNKKEAGPVAAAAPASPDIWSSIIASKKESNDDSSKSGSSVSVALPPPYIHPSVKRTSSTLSEKSLEICTESLGSETGSDRFSSYPSSETEPESDPEEREEQQQLQLQQQTPVVDQQSQEQGLAYVGVGAEELHVPKYNYNIASTKTVAAKSFPPPLPSLAHRDGTNLHMRSHRQNGRLVLEAVSVPSQNCFRAQRQDGRLLLTLAASSTESPEKDTVEVAKKMIINDVDEEENDINEIDLEETDEYSTDSDEDEEEDAFERDKDNNVGANNGLSILMADHLVAKYSKGSMINMQAGGKVLALISRNNNQSVWPDHNNKRFNKVVTKTTTLDQAADEQPTAEPQKSLASSLPPRPKTVCRRLITDTASADPAKPTSLHHNTYEYYWRKTKPPIAGPTKASLTTTKNQDAFLHGCGTVDVGSGPPQNATMIKEIEKPKNKFITENVVPAAFKGMSTSSIVEQTQQQNHQDQPSNLMVVNKGRSEGGEYLVPLLMQQGCKEARRSLLFWKPYCIATT